MLVIVGVGLLGLLLGVLLQKALDHRYPSRPGMHSHRLPLIGVALGILFPVYHWTYGLQPMFAKSCLFGAGMSAVCVVNYRTLLVPNVLTLHGIAAGLLLSTITPPGILSAALGVLGGAGALWLIAEVYYRSHGAEGLGFGLVKLQGVIGAFLGWRLMIVALVIAAMAGSGAGLVLTARGTAQRSVPFGSYMAVGAIVSSLYGEAIIRWYVSFL